MSPSPGERILDEIIKQGMVQVAHPPIPSGEAAVLVWSANAVDQLDALVRDLAIEIVEGMRDRP